ncbi:hypothetical protein ACJRO7_015115 [Eucalyptus globulus]|uniref:Salutaridinol 7-O-acetyltransferase n=1 Tax=Eucalyptus globulus TaxID=34317 RepID=A0ABD3L349_EUCGL
MATKIEVVSTETIKPSSPTPPHLRNFNFCLLDQLGGRVKGNAGIDCNDEGALYMEAKARFELSKVLSNPAIDKLQQFLPFAPRRISTNIDEQVIVGVQANFFDCGGMGISICISHKIADGASVSSFLNAWSKIANNGVDSELSLITPFLKASDVTP